MILSTKGRYGLKAAFELALNYGRGPLSLKNISQKYEISENYLEQILIKLKKKGYVETVRGVNGGYMLSDTPENITVGMILRTLEHDFTASGCLSGEECSNESNCATGVIFKS